MTAPNPSSHPSAPSQGPSLTQTERLQLQLAALERRRQWLLAEIARTSSVRSVGLGVLIALCSRNTSALQQQTRDVQSMQRELAEVQAQMCTAHEHLAGRHFAQAFEEELAKAPSAVFLTPAAPASEQEDDLAELEDPLLAFPDATSEEEDL